MLEELFLEMLLPLSIIGMRETLKSAFKIDDSICKLGFRKDMETFSL